MAPTLVEAVERLAHDSARGFVFVRPDGTERLCTFADIHRECLNRAAHLSRMGMKKGERVALVIPDGDEFVLSFLGALFAGVVPVPIYPQLTFKNVETYHDTVAHIANASGATVLLTTEATRPYVEPVVPRVSALRTVMSVERFRDQLPESPRISVHPEDLAFLQFTSGSTSKPKGVMVTHANLAANSKAFMVDGLGKDSSVDKGVSWLPLFHDMGLIGFVVGPLFTDIPCVFLPTASFVRSPRIWLDTIHKHRGTITYAPNFAYALVAKRLKEKEVEGWDLSCVRIAGCGAEPISGKSLRDFAERLKPAKFDPKAFLPSYGMAEATLAITFVPRGIGLRTDHVDSQHLRDGDAKSAPESNIEGAQDIVDCGKVFPEHELAIIHENGEKLGDRQVGQIVTRGPSVTPGYYQEPELTRESFKDGWLYTGDLGYTVDGNLFVCGRLKDLIIIRGRNFYPNDIEFAVGELAGVRRGNAVAFSVPSSGEEHLVVVVEASRTDAEKIVKGVQQVVTAQFGLTVHAVEIVSLGSLPRTSSGKPQRRKVRQLFLDGELRARAVQANGDGSADGSGDGANAGP